MAQKANITYFKNYSDEQYEIIPVGEIQPSQTQLQKLRRERITDKDLQELTLSIKEEGVIEPIILRQLQKGFEIVAGESRWRSAVLATHTHIPAIIRELTDEQALRLQLHENLHRKDPNPLDEAIGYQEILDSNNNLTSDDVAGFVGKTVKYVDKLLVLNDLIPEALEDVKRKQLPIKYAKEIAKYTPEQQKYILEEIVYVQNDKEQGVETYRTLKHEINRTIKLELSLAPFDLNSTELRKDKLSCLKCPQRTGARHNLFDEDEIGDNDKCLNRACFEDKREIHLRIELENVANENKEESYKSTITLSSESYSVPDDYPNALINNYSQTTYAPINSEEEKCDKVKTAVWVDGSKKGSRQLICTTASCTKHFQSETHSSNKKSESTPEELEAKRRRREELNDIKVREPIRKDVLESAKESFDNTNWIFNHELLLVQMVAKLFLSIYKDDKKRFYMICEIMGFDKNDVQKNEYWLDADEVFTFCKTISPTELSQILFLCMNIQVGEMRLGDNYRSQKDIIAMADDAGFNYKLADAENRLEHASKKYKPIFEDYLEEVREGKTAKIPRAFTQTYKNED